MADTPGFSHALAGLAFLSGAISMADFVAKACSSPQTAEINASSRSATLMKWVKVGLIEGSAMVIIAAWISPEVGLAFLAGGALEGVITFAEYQHANAAGLNSNAPGTEGQGRDGIGW